jgi:diacylglycerol O-acyltransferase
MQRLTALDAAFLDLETDESRANVAWFSVFEGPAPDHGELVRYIEGKLALVPRYRQKLRFLPLGIARPLWIDDPNFNLDYHIRRTALPAPGGEEQLTRLFARVVSQQLDRSHPLWEMWVAEGLGENRWAVLWKLHHAMVDGVTANEINTVILSDEPEAHPSAPASWRPEPAPGRRAPATESHPGSNAGLPQTSAGQPIVCASSLCEAESRCATT